MVNGCPVCEAQYRPRPGYWTVEELEHDAFLVNPNGYRVARMTSARAHGISAALNTEQGAAAFEQGRLRKP